jgi:5-dehydro-4-deoxyglucarate dehydratase
MVTSLRLEGVIAFPVTPFTASGELDLEGLRANLARLVSHPLAAVVAAGGTGEVYSLSEQEHDDVVRHTTQVVGDRIPVIAGTGGSIGAAVAMARNAARAGATAILALPPSYPHADADGLVAYYQAIGAATPLPLIVYSRDWVNPSAALVQRMADAIPTLAVWKDGQGDIRRYQQIITRLGDRLQWVGGAGDDLVGAYYRLGIRAFTSSIANVAPRLALALHEAAASGDDGRIHALLEAHVIPLYELRGRRKGYEVSAMKVMMALQGQAAGPVRAPLVEVRAEELDELRDILDGWAQFVDSRTG